jgi:hypothetical protein
VAVGAEGRARERRRRSRSPSRSPLLLIETKARDHVTVRVVLPKDAEALAFRPLELARINGKPLPLQDVTLVMDVAGATPAKPPRERLRVLGLFSMPDGEQPANLRQARYSLVRLIRAIAASGRAADVRVLQYGVTRDRLRDVLEDGEGWDIIHISAHGEPGALVLETADGRRDSIDAAELSELLELARGRVRLVTLAACWSAAATVAAQRRMLGPPEAHYPERTVAAPPSAPDSGPLASELAGKLACAVLAMRFPVTDEFAIALTAKLYDLLVAKGRDLPDALAITLRHLADRAGGQADPALPLAAPALFGGCAAGLTLKAPERTGPRSYGTDELKLAGFPPSPERFVGRTGVMARASEALAAGSSVPGVLWSRRAIRHGKSGGTAGRLLRGRRDGREPEGLHARPRGLDQGGHRHFVPRRTGSVLVPVLPGRTRPHPARPRRHLGGSAAPAQPRRAAA